MEATRHDGIERLLSIEEAREILGVSEPTFSRIRRRGDVPIVRLGARTLIDPADLRAYVDECKVRRTGEPERRGRRPRDDERPAGEPSVRASAEAGGGRGAR